MAQQKVDSRVITEGGKDRAARGHAERETASSTIADIDKREILAVLWSTLEYPGGPPSMRELVDFKIDMAGRESRLTKKASEALSAVIPGARWQVDYDDEGDIALGASTGGEPRGFAPYGFYDIADVHAAWMAAGHPRPHPYVPVLRALQALEHQRSRPPLWWESLGP